MSIEDSVERVWAPMTMMMEFVHIMLKKMCLNKSKKKKIKKKERKTQSAYFIFCGYDHLSPGPY